MAAVAVILAELVQTVSQHRTVWADGPEFSITVSDENYETANVSFTISNLSSEVDENNWIVQIITGPRTAKCLTHNGERAIWILEAIISMRTLSPLSITTGQSSLQRMSLSQNWFQTASTESRLLLKNTGITYTSPKTERNRRHSAQLTTGAMFTLTRMATLTLIMTLR